ncbi:AAA family ATPase [Kamptonema animale CS-326]|uniref:trifunctional serine/threonine-protein kinase/ATP-binding protein/sensor histidine kinase n=1 Tax=Kamptonema animale TaxID=92934 RepID=UPI00232EBFE4|nr:trifunctional serine/threonine-protein kinase/ATP-binding protein/sensor histidine kinase [Kamptonema animale]MDB9515330.1 AAA family ATPase [Kamptonema animale CS-326]
MNNSHQNSKGDTTVQIPSYQIIETVYSGSRTLVYRAIRNHDQLPVIIKLLKNEYPTFSELVQFRNQYTIAKNLCQAGIIQTYSLEPYRNGYALVMEDFGGISLQEWAIKEKNALSLRELLEIAIALCNILDILYRDRVIHKDIKPSNILINPETKQVKLIDFSIASLLPRETQTLINPNVLEGTLAYISPEQTGRMNRGIDYRTDFYSLGVTFYELLTGDLPFQSNEPMDLVHCHIAKTAPLVHEINPQIPFVISEIVKKLMAKNAEDRYQSALGLKYDLEKCLTQLQESGQIQYFEIACRDVCDRFTIPDKLYGRETEVETLLQAFERVANPPESPLRPPPESPLAKGEHPPQSPLAKGGHRGVEMMLIAGFSGIGKTAVVNEIHKPIVRQRGYFIKGKYDQFQRNIPFSAFVQAFRDLMGQLLTESESQIQQWQSKILAAVGENGQVIIDVIPELERIIGQQPAPPQLSGTAAQNRFNLLFQKFTQVFTTAQHPLVIFLDDLQWADSASLKLMQLLMADTGYLFLIGAYRDNEVNSTHPLMLALSEIQKAQAIINTITLLPLSQEQVNQLVADTLKSTESWAGTLSQLVYQKTQGNPFFATQFLKALHQDNLIKFDFGSGRWQCDITQVNQLAVTNEVVTFMALQLGKLPDSTQQVLQLAACIGNQFDLVTLAIVSEQSQVETAAVLWKALQEGLILPVGDVYKFYVGQESQIVTKENHQVVTYKFLHDRVQQAAYSLIPNERKQATHLQIGQLLLRNTVLAEREEILFEIVNQLNRGRYLLNDPEEQERLSHLNLLAGRKAKTSTAYTAACEYITTGMELLRENCWHIQYELCFALHKERVEVEYLNGNIEASKMWIDRTLEQTRTPLEKAEIYNLAIIQYTLRAEYPEAIAAGIKALSLFGIDINDEDFEVVRDREIATAQAILESRGIAALSDLPMMTDPEKKMATKLAIAMGPPTYRSHQRLWSVICAKAVNLCLQYGNTPEIGYIYPAYGGLRGYALNNYQNTGELIDLTLQLMPKFNNSSAESVAYLMIGSSLRHWSHPLKVASQDYQNSYQIGLESSNLQYAAYAFGHNMYCRFYQGVELKQLEAEINQSLAFSQQQKNQWAIDLLTGGQMLVANLRGTITWSETREDEYLERCRKHKNWQVICIYTILKSQILYLCDRPESALESAEKAEAEIVNVAPQGLLPYARHRFIYALLLCQSYERIPQAEQSAMWQKLIEYKQQLAVWAQNCSENFSAASELISAEMARISGDKLLAIELYDRAIAAASQNALIPEEALANELAAKFYWEWNKEKVAQAYMIEAYYCYSRWGAKTKIEDLEKRYSKLLSPIKNEARYSFNDTITRGEISFNRSSSTVSEALDLATMLKASQAISGEIELDKLLAILLKIASVNAGATKCVLLLKQEIELRLAALMEEGQEPQILSSMPLALSQDVALSLVNAVKHSLEARVVVDARLNPQFAGDPYIEQYQPKSILCSPIINQGLLIGILYLENNLTVGAFTSDRVELLNLLCTQAAISLENARLYERSQQALTELRASEARFQKLTENLPGLIYQIRLAPDGSVSIPYVSPGCADLYEVPPEEFLTGIKDFRMLEHPDDRAAMTQAFVHSAQSLMPFEQEWRIITTSGTVKWVQAASRPERQADGSIIWDGVMIDISDRKLAEKSLRLTQFAIDRSSVPVWWVKPSGQVAYVNDAACRDLGYSRTEILQKCVGDFNPDLSSEVWEKHWDELKEQGSFIFETYNFNKSGHRYPVEVTVNYLELDGEEYNCAFVKNISDRKLAELALQQKSLLLEQALYNLQNAQLQIVQSEKMSALGNLVAGVAHEMNNPLGFISASLEQAKPTVTELIAHLKLYQASLPNPNDEILDHAEEIDLEYTLEDLPKIINSMEIACERLKNISTSLRTFSRADRDYKVPFNIHEGIDSTILILKHRLKANDRRPAIEVIADYGKLPKIDCFPGQLNQVFMNIMANAIDALDESNIGRSLADIKANPNSIKITTSIQDKAVKISIADNGTGMDESVKAKIFDHLFTTKAVGKGTGLGLAIARQIIEEKHHGSIQVNSTLGRGTEFIISLPTKAEKTS